MKKFLDGKIDGFGLGVQETVTEILQYGGGSCFRLHIETEDFEKARKYCIEHKLYDEELAKLFEREEPCSNEDVWYCALKMGLPIYLIDREDGKRYTLTLKDLIKAFKDEMDYQEWNAGDWDGQADSESYSNVLQRAVLKEVVYGD